MAKYKKKAVFVCKNCGGSAPKWEGRCPSCREWNSLVEHTAEYLTSIGGFNNLPSVPLQELSKAETDQNIRWPLRMSEVNRVLGGGIVTGSIVLIAGEPGVGKSTLLIRLASDIADSVGEVLYVSGEESIDQIKIRADRLGVSGDRLFVLQTTSLNDVVRELNKKLHRFVIVDSIQTMIEDSVESGPGNLSQIRECTRILTQWAKTTNVPIIITGHVTKGGDVAGPKALEHMVDVVLYLEGDPINSWRLLRAVKNRFGTTNEIGVFEMTESGLVEIKDPSAAFLSEHRNGSVGSVVVAALEGSRPLLVEVQALTNSSALSTPRRVVSGVDFNRVLLVCAVLTRRAGVALSQQDVVVNVTGGLKTSEPAVDLGIALAIASSLYGVPIPQFMMVTGEIGLNGEVRNVPQLSRRLVEAERLGFQQCLVPSTANGDVITGLKRLDVMSVATVKQALGTAFGSEMRVDSLPDLGL